MRVIRCTTLTFLYREINTKSSHIFRFFWLRSDNTKFELLGLHELYITLLVKPVGGHIMLWGCFSSLQINQFYFCQKQTNKKTKQIKKHLTCFLFIFQNYALLCCSITQNSSKRCCSLYKKLIKSIFIFWGSQYFSSIFQFSNHTHFKFLRIFALSYFSDTTKEISYAQSH